MNPIRSVFSPFSPHRGPMDYLDVVWLRRWWVVTGLILGTLGGIAAFSLMPKKYRSSTTVLVEADKAPDRLLPEAAEENRIDIIGNVREQLMDRRLVKRVRDETHAYSSASEGAAIESIRGSISVRPRGGDAFVIECTDTDPVRAQQIASRLAAVFIEEASGAKERDVSRAAEFYAAQLQQTQQELQQKEEALRAHKQRYMGLMPEQLGDNTARLEKLEADARTVVDSITAAKNRKKLLERQIEIEAEPDPPPPPAPPPVASPTELDTARSELTELRRRYAPEHPDVKALQARIRKLEVEPPPQKAETVTSSTIPASTKGDVATLKAQVEAVEDEIRALEAREVELQEQIKQGQRRMQTIPLVEQERDALTREHELLSQRYTELLKHGLEAEMAGAIEKRWKESFRILVSAEVPDAPFSPQAPLFMGGGVILGLAAGVGLCFLFELLDHSIKDRHEIKALLPAHTLLVSIPHVRVSRKS